MRCEVSRNVACPVAVLHGALDEVPVARRVAKSEMSETQTQKVLGVITKANENNNSIKQTINKSGKRNEKKNNADGGLTNNAN